MYNVYLKYQKLKSCVEIIFQWNYSLNLFPQWCEYNIDLLDWKQMQNWNFENKALY